MKAGIKKRDKVQGHKLGWDCAGLPRLRSFLGFGTVGLNISLSHSLSMVGYQSLGMLKAEGAR